MFLFKNTKSIVKRIAMNMAVYGFASVFVLIILALFLPEIIAKYVYVLMVACSVISIVGLIVSVIWFFIELFIPAKAVTVGKSPQTTSNEVEHMEIGLFYQRDQCGPETRIKLQFENGGEISIVCTEWWPGLRGEPAGAQTIIKLDSDYFIKNSIDDFVGFLTSKFGKDFSHLRNKQAIVELFDIPVFKMETQEGQLHRFAYCGHNRYSPNSSSRCGYGSDDWMYLCKENDRYYLLMFSDNAEFGTTWTCTELLEGDYEQLLNEDVNFWGSIAYSKERIKTYRIRLTDVDSVRRLLPTSSRRCSKLTDEYYLR